MRFIARLHGLQPAQIRKAGHNAFTLIELLVVISIIVVMTALILPAFNSIGSSGNFTKAVYDIAGTIEQARAYARAKNTYVFVGIEEVDASIGDSVKPQVATSVAKPAGGRVSLCVAASRNGTRNFDPNDPDASWTKNYANGANLVMLDKLQRFENLHLMQQFQNGAAGTAMARGTVNSNATSSHNLGNPVVDDPNTGAKTPFSYPLGSPLTGAGYQYLFRKVFYFDPQGVARIQYQSTVEDIDKYIEIGLQPSHASVVPAFPANINVGNQVAIQLDCLTGAVRVYRP